MIRIICMIRCLMHRLSTIRRNYTNLWRRWWVYWCLGPWISLCAVEFVGTRLRVVSILERIFEFWGFLVSIRNWLSWLPVVGECIACARSIGIVSSRGSWALSWCSVALMSWHVGKGLNMNKRNEWMAMTMCAWVARLNFFEWSRYVGGLRLPNVWKIDGGLFRILNVLLCCDLNVLYRVVCVTARGRETIYTRYGHSMNHINNSWYSYMCDTYESQSHFVYSTVNDWISEIDQNLKFLFGVKWCWFLDNFIVSVGNIDLYIQIPFMS